jgi:acetolactate synthase-1/2/3 large subunit
MITVADYIFKFLKKQKVEHIFMLSGGGAMHLCNSLGHSKLGYICCLHEQAASVAALAYAQYKNDIGVALVTSGPGATNAITGVVAAWTESVPMLVLSGQVKTQDSAKKYGVRTKGVQECPIIDMVKPVTKYAITITKSDEIAEHLEKALYLAKNGRRGPVWLDIPLDIQSAKINENKLKHFKRQENTDRYSSAQLPLFAKKIIELIKKSERPVILAGYGIRVANAIDSFLELANRLNIPILTTWKAADIIPDKHPLFFGCPGIAGQRAANFVQQNADLIICIGARLDFPQTGFDQTQWARNAKKVIVDIDPAELSKFKFKAEISICTSALDFINTLNKLKPHINIHKNWLEKCKYWNRTYTRVLPEHYQKKNFTSLYVLAESISNALTKNDIYVPGSSGMGSDVPYQTTRIKEGTRMFNSPGLGSMGFGIPSAIGACIASGKKRVVCVNGDGGFQMNIQELQTIKSLNLPVKFFLINNNGYASIRNTQRTYFKGFYVGSSPESGVSLPNIKKQTLSYGFDYFSIKNNTHIKDIVNKVFENNKPTICEVFIDPNDTLCFRASSFIKPDGTAISRPIEDLAPFLPRKEFYGNMLIKPLNKTGINLCNILFDLDGTLIDSSAGIINSMLHALRSVDRNKIKSAIGLPLLPMIKKLLPNITEEEANVIAKRYRSHYSKIGLYNSVLYDGVFELLDMFSKEYNLYIVTSKPVQFAESIAKKLNIHKYFKSIKGPDLSFIPKNKTELISELLKKEGLTPESCIMIGDRAEDILAAETNNIKTIGVSYGYGSAKELDKAILIANSTYDLMEILL